MTDVQVWMSEAGVDVLVGTLYSRRRRGTESATFLYDETYLARQGAYELDPALPLMSGQHQTPTGLSLFNAFSDASPDRWGRTLIDRVERSRARTLGETPRTLSELDYLIGVRDDLRQGALRFKIGDGPFLATDESEIPMVHELGELLEISAKVEDDAAGSDELERLLRAGSSLGGMRPKSHVRDKGRYAIAKFPSARLDTWNVMAWEKVALDLAASAGVDVPDSELIQIGTRHVLIVTRFDRDDNGHRIGYCSALTMVEGRDGQQSSYLDIAARIEEVSGSPSEELRQLWRRIAFTILISNTDDHLRNHGFLRSAGHWRLAPAFDLNPNPAPGAKHLSTAIDDVENRASIGLLMEVAPFFRLNPDDAKTVLAEICEAVSGWREVAAAQDLSARDIEAMSDAFEHRERETAEALLR